MLSNLKRYNIILASNSPRRKELLSGLGIDYVVQSLPNIDESYPEELKGGEIPQYLAQKKAKAYCSLMKENDLIITADTLVCFQEKILGKPKNIEESLYMLQKLSGNTHKVFTGVCLTTKEQTISFVSCTEVSFSTLSKDEIMYYINKYKPFDKAGSYGVQEWIGYIGVEKISGSFYNVMGLPIQRLYTELKKIK